DIFFYFNLSHIYSKFLFNLVFFNFTKFCYLNKFFEVLNQNFFFFIKNFKLNKRFFNEKDHLFILQLYKNVNSYLTKLFLILFCKMKNNFIFYKKYKIIFKKINIIVKNEYSFYKKYKIIFHFFSKFLQKINSNSKLYLMALKKYVTLLEIESADLFNRDIMLYNVSSIIDDSKDKRGKHIN